MGSFAPYTRARHSCHHCTRPAMSRAGLRWPRWGQACGSFASFAAVRPAFGLVWPVLSQSPRRASSDRWRARDHFLRNRWRLSVGSVVLAENFRLRLRCGSRRASSSSALHGMGTVWFFLRNRWRRSVAPDDAHGSLGGGRVWAVASGGPIGVWLKCIVKRGGRVATADVAFTHTPITTCVFVVSVIPSYQNISPWRQIT